MLSYFVGYRNDRFFSHTNPYILNVTQQCRCSYFELGLPVNKVVSTSPTLSALLTSTCPQLSYLATFLCLDKVTVVLTLKKVILKFFSTLYLLWFCFSLVSVCFRDFGYCGSTLVTGAYIKESTFS